MTYLSGAMSGIPDHNFPAFREACKQLRANGYRICSPHEESPGVEGKQYSYYIHRDLIALLQRCDSIALLPGWEHSAGAQLEYAVAKACGYLMYDVVEGRLVGR